MAAAVFRGPRASRSPENWWTEPPKHHSIRQLRRTLQPALPIWGVSIEVIDEGRDEGGGMGALPE